MLNPRLSFHKANGKKLFKDPNEATPVSLKKRKAVTARTDKKKFSSENNPHDLIRCAQKEKYVWYAAYDEEMLFEKFTELLNLCKDKTLPIVLTPYTIRK